MSQMDEEENEMDTQANSGDSGWINIFVFISGFLLGAGAALLVAPEAGENLRGRLARGAKIAQDELSEITADSKEALHNLSSQTQEAVKKASTRMTAAYDATKKAVKNSPNKSPEE